MAIPRTRARSSRRGPMRCGGTDATRFYTEREGVLILRGVGHRSARGRTLPTRRASRAPDGAGAPRSPGRGTLAGHGLAVSLGRLDARTTRLLAGRLTHPLNGRLLQHLRILLESGAGVRRLDVALAHGARGAPHALPVGHLPRVGVRGVFLDLGRAEPVQPTPSAEGAHALQQKAPSRSAGATGTDASGRSLAIPQALAGPERHDALRLDAGLLALLDEAPGRVGIERSGGPRGREPGERRLVAVVAVAVRLG